MPKYDVGQARFFPLLGRKAYPGETIELPEDVAAEVMQSDPGILKPQRRTTQRSPEVVRSEPAAELLETVTEAAPAEATIPETDAPAKATKRRSRKQK